MVEAHRHTGGDSPRVDAKDLTGPVVITTTFQVSAVNIRPSIIQRGTYTLANGVKLITFPQIYSTTTDLYGYITPTGTATPAVTPYVNGIVASAMTISGSGTETGYWLAIGYK